MGLCAMLLALVTLAGCSVSPMVKRASAFATAATAAAKDTTNAYALVEQTHHDAEVQAMIANFDKEGFHPEKIKPFMSAQDMTARTKILDGLSKYAETLAYIGGDQPMTDFDTQAEALGKSLQDLSATGSIGAFLQSSNVTGVDVNLATTAVDALGRALIEHKRSRELPALLKEMNGPITQICALLEADIGDPEKSGLRNQLKNDYETLKRRQITFIRDNEGKMSVSDKRALLEELAKMADDEAAGDKTLAATQAALKQLAATHAALAESGNAKEAPVFRTMLSELMNDSQQLQGFYSKLPAQ
ncbi:MAG TPA: hypothetical protein VG893_14510 [Terracidiphilus sp.]|nr:hypothetical protein [Terracidiphilus sp.]